MSTDTNTNSKLTSKQRQSLNLTYRPSLRLSHIELCLKGIDTLKVKNILTRAEELALAELNVILQRELLKAQAQVGAAYVGVSDDARVRVKKEVISEELLGGGLSDTEKLIGLSAEEQEEYWTKQMSSIAGST